MRRYLAGVAEMLCLTLCTVTGDFCGCWLLNSEWSPLSRLYRWAVLFRWDDPSPSESGCPTCHFDRNAYIPRSQWDEDMERYYEMGEESGREEALKELTRNQATTSNGGGATSTHTYSWPA